MAKPENQSSSTTVLVVFRRRSVANLIAECLKDAGYVAAVAEGYDDALRTVAVIQPDAAVVSASEVEGNPAEFLTQLDCMPASRGIPTVLVAPTKIQAMLADVAAHRHSRRGYLSWPLKCADLQLIIQALLHTDEQRPEPVSSKELVLDPRLRILRGRAGTTILTPAECRLAEYLMSQGGRPIALEDLLTRVFGFYRGNGNPALVRAHVASVRQKIKIVTGGRDLIRLVGRRGFVYLGG
jgi:DNA-binding response OmpR family regulator